MRHLLIKSRLDDARDRAAADPDAAIVEGAQSALDDQIEAADTKLDREKATRRLVLFVRTHAKVFSRARESLSGPGQQSRD